MEKIEIFTAKTYDEIKTMAAQAFGADALDIQFETIEEPKKGLFGMKGEFRVRAIYNAGEESTASLKAAAAPVKAAPTASQSAESGKSKGEVVDSARFKHIIDYIEAILTQLGVKGYTITVRNNGENNIIDISGDNLGIIIGRRGETLDSLQYLSILANNRSGEENAKLRLVVDCNGYREKRAETLEALAIRTSNKVIKQGRRVTLEPMNPYERRIIHSKVASIDGVFSNSIGEEPYRKVVISAEIVKRRDGRDAGRGDNRGNNRGDRNRERGERRPANAGPMISGRDYKQSASYSTSFERDYKRSLSEAPTEISQETVDVEKSASLYGKIEL
jgi:spoIIIJ-associated protein